MSFAEPFKPGTGGLGKQVSKAQRKGARILNSLRAMADLLPQREVKTIQENEVPSTPVIM